MSNIAIPKRRIWLYPIGDGNLEIVLLGDATPEEGTPEAENIAAIWIHLRKLAEAHPGWDRVDVLAMGPTVIGLRVHCAARHAAIGDVMQEALRMFKDGNALKWSGGNAGSDSALGMVGIW